MGSTAALDSAAARPHVGVVILNYENAEDTEACVATLRRVDYNPLDVVVVDNDSSPECYRHLEAVAAANPGLLLARNSRNAGYAAGNNVGIRIALERGADYILVLNNDCLVPPGMLEPLVSSMEGDSSIAIAIPRLLDEQGKDETPLLRRPTYWSYYTRFGVISALRGVRGVTSEPRYRASGDDAATYPLEVPVGACMLMRSDFLRDIGLLDEGTFLYQEEVILTEQARSRGKRVVLVPAATVTHLRGRTTRNFKLRRTLAMWRSQNYYLRCYRGIGLLPRAALIGYQVASIVTITTLRPLARLLRRAARLRKASRSG